MIYFGRGKNMKRILIVDDVEINRELLCNMLSDEYAVDMAADGEEALAMLEEERSETAAILLDLHMPKMDGFAVIRALKQKGWLNRIPVLIISS